MTRRQIQSYFPGWTFRKIQAVVAQSSGQAIGGQKGYRATSCASLDEINHYEARIQREILKLQIHLKDVQKIKHGRRM